MKVFNRLEPLRDGSRSGFGQDLESSATNHRIKACVRRIIFVPVAVSDGLIAELYAAASFKGNDQCKGGIQTQKNMKESKDFLKLARRRPMLVGLVLGILTFGLLFSGWLTPMPGKAQPDASNPQSNG